MRYLFLAALLLITPAHANRLVAEATSCSGTQVQLNNVPVAKVLCYGGKALALDPAAHLSGKIYDVFDTGLSLCTGPAWANNNTRSPGGNCTGTYIGTFLATGNGQTSWVLLPAPVAGGSNNILGVYNAQNRVRVMAHEWDAFPQYAELLGPGHTYELFNRSANNKITWVDGEGVEQRSIRSTVTASPVNAGLSGGSTLVCIDYTGDNVCHGKAGTTYLSNQQGTAVWAAQGVDSGQTYYAETITSGIGVHTASLLVSFPSPAWLYGYVASGMILDGNF